MMIVMLILPKRLCAKLMKRLFIIILGICAIFARYLYWYEFRITPLVGQTDKRCAIITDGSAAADEVERLLFAPADRLGF